MKTIYRRRLNRILSFVLAAVLAMPSVSSCGKKEQEVDNSDCIYDLSQVECSDFPNLAEFYLEKRTDKIIMYGMAQDPESGYNIADFIHLNDKGEILSRNRFSLGPDKYNDVSLNEKGDLYVVMRTTEQEYPINTGADEAEPEEPMEKPEEPTEEPQEPSAETEEISTEPDAEADDDSSADSDNTADMAVEPSGVSTPDDAADGAPELNESAGVGPGDDADGNADEEELEKYYEFAKIDNNGKLTVDKNMADDPAVAALDGIDEDGFVKFLVTDVNNNVYAVTSNYILIYDEDLNYKSMYDKRKGDLVFKDFYDVEMNYVQDKSGKNYVKYMDASFANNYANIDMSTGKKISSFKPANDFRWDDFKTGSDYDFFICKSSCLYGYNVGDDEPVKIIDFTLSNIVANRINSAVSIGENKYMSIYSSMEDNRFHLGILTKNDNPEANNKEILTLVTTDTNSNLTKAVVMFNRSNPDYCVRIVDYWDLYGKETDDFQAVIDKLNTDIISGNMPDMLLLDPSMPINTYIGKDLIEDLRPYIDNDSEFSFSDFNENVMNTFSYDGKIYVLVPGYKLSTAFVKDKFLEGRKSWNISEAEEIWENSGIQLFMEPKSASEFLGDCLCAASAQFVDWENCKCYFDTDEFKAFIKFADKLPKSEDEVDYSVYRDYDEWFKKDKCLCDMVSVSRYGSSMAIGDINRYIYVIHSDFSEPCTAVGFPTYDGEGNALDASMQLAMSSKSKHKDGCWNFLRFFLTEKYQNSASMSSDFPVLNSAMNARLQKATQTLYTEYEDLNGKLHQEPIYIYHNGEKTPLPPLTEEETQEFMNIINSVKRTTRSDTKIMKIVDEEYAEYLDGKSSMEDMTKRIQSRIQIYMYESM